MTEPNSEPGTEQQQANRALEFLKGVGLAIALYGLVYAGLWVLLYVSDLIVYVLTGVPNSRFPQSLYQIWLFGLFAFGLVQWLYILPVAWWLQSEGKVARTRGLVAIAVVVSLLNGLAFWKPGLLPIV